MHITIATTPGSPKMLEVPMVNGVSSIEKPVKEEVKCSISRVMIPITADVSRVLKNFLVLSAKNKTIITASVVHPIIM